MFKIFIIVALIIWLSTTAGSLLRDRFNLQNMKYTAPLGFAAILFVLQLIYYPIQLFNLPSFYIHLITLIVFIALFIVSLFLIVKNIKQFLKLDSIWLVFSLGLFFVVFYYSAIDITYADGQMYLNYISQNISIDKLNNFNLWTGLVGEEFVTVYLFQGYYHFAGSFVLMVNSFHNIFRIGAYIDNIVVLIWGLGSLYAIISGLLIIDMANYIKTKSPFIKHTLILFSLFFTNFYYWKTAFAYYGNTWRSLFMAMMIYYFYRLIKESNSDYKYLIAIIFGASLSASSSSLFIGFSILLGIAYYYFKDNNIRAFEDTSIIGIPMVLYVLAVTYKDHPTIFPYLLLISIVYYASLVFNLTSKYLRGFNQFISKYAGLIFILVIPGIAIIYSLLDMYIFDPEYIWSMRHYFNNHATYDMVKNYLFLHSGWVDNTLNVLRWMGVLILILYYRNEKSNTYLVRHFLLLAVFFLNPLTTSFISKMFASNVYYRAFESFFNVFTEMVLFATILNHFWNKKVLRMSIIFLLVFVTGFSHIQSLILKDRSGLYGYYISTGQELDPIYKLQPLELEAIKAFKEEVWKNPKPDGQITVVSHADGLRTFTPDVYVVFTARQFWSAWDRIDQDFYQVARMWHGWEDRPAQIDYSKSCDYLVKYNIDYVINEAWLNYEFNEAIKDCTTMIFENYEYKVRKVKN